MIVMNVSSVAFVSRYLKTGMPLVERMLTVDGDVIGNPCNVVVPMGTPVRMCWHSPSAIWSVRRSCCTAAR